MIKISKNLLTDQIKKKIYDGFSRHAIAMTGYDEKSETIVFTAMENDQLLGAIAVQLFWGALHIKYLFIEEDYRNKKLGTRLIGEAFKFAEERRCPFAFVETMSFQALEFYQKCGFKVEFTRSGYSHNTSFHYLRRDFV